jgi:hypothetical protein
MNWDLPITRGEIEAREELGCSETVEDILNSWERINIWFAHGVQSSVVYAKSPRGTFSDWSIGVRLLFNEDHRGIPRGGRSTHNTCFQHIRHNSIHDFSVSHRDSIGSLFDWKSVSSVDPMFNSVGPTKIVGSGGENGLEFSQLLSESELLFWR